MGTGVRGGGDGQPGVRFGIDLFIEDGAYTTLAAAVTILVVLALVFSAATAAWSLARAGDIQVSADSAALAGANVVSSYSTVATVVDASIASLGFAGLAVTGAGMVGLLVPGAQAAASQAVEAGTRMLEARNSFAASASKGLKTLEQSLPYLVAANATRICAEQSTDSQRVAGTAIAVPWESASSYPAMEDSGKVPVDDIVASSAELEEVAGELSRASEESAAAKEAAWLADCGREGMNMQERAERLSGLSGEQNPDYASSITWEPSVALDRARAYYRWRLDHDRPQGSDVESLVDSVSRQAFYRLASEWLADAAVEERDGVLVSSVPLLPKNTEEMRKTSLYTELAWPTSVESGGITLHFSASCPGALGPSGPTSSLASIDAGASRECAVCRFTIADVGKAPAASTSIDNGFEYHLRDFTLALDDYVAARNRELELERKAQGQADRAGASFEEAISALVGKRPSIAPPGRYGCVGLVVSGPIESPAELESGFSEGAALGSRGAVSAAVLAPDPATRENNVLSEFFSSLEARVGKDGVVGLVGSVMDLWGELLVSYGDMGEGLSGMMDRLVGGADKLGAGPIARGLRDRLTEAVKGLGLEPVDLRLRKPVLTDTGNVIAHADAGGLSDVQGLLRSLPLTSTDPAEILSVLGYRVEGCLESLEFTVAEIPLPGGGSIPLTVRVRDFVGEGSGGA